MTPEIIYEATGKPVKLAGRRIGDANFAGFVREFERRSLNGFIHLEWAGNKTSDEAFEAPGPQPRQIEEYGSGILILRGGRIIKAFATEESEYARNLIGGFYSFDFHSQIAQVSVAEAMQSLSFLAKVIFNKLKGFETDGYAEVFYDPSAASLAGDGQHLELENYEHVRTNSLADYLGTAAGATVEPEWSWT